MSSWTSADRMIPLDLDGPADLDFSPFEDAWIDLPLIERFEQTAARHGERLAVADASQRLSYRELHQRSNRLANLVAATVPQGHAVGILLPHNALFPVAALACMATGRPYVPLDIKYPPARIRAIIDEAGLASVIVESQAEGRRLLPPACGVIEVNDGATAPARVRPASRSVDEPAVILYTSGSTGAPKGICNSQRAILQRVAEATNSCHLRADDRCILLSSPGTIAGEREMFAALLNGASLYVTDPQRDGILNVLNTLGERCITVGYAVPSLLRMLLRMPGAPAAFSHMRVIRIGGDITLDSDLALFRAVAPSDCHFFASFSSTEIPAAFQWFVPRDWKADGPRVPIGRARPGIDFMLLGEDGSAGDYGELVVRSPYLALGHWRHGAVVPGPFIADPADSSLRQLHTGDIVKRRSDGLWELIGRKDRQVKIRGQRVDAAEVEAALRSCSRVADAAVVARRSGEEVVALAAFVVPAAPGDSGLLCAVKQAVAHRVPQFMQPADIHIIDAIPQLPGFKADLAALVQRDRAWIERTAGHARPTPGDANLPVGEAAAIGSLPLDLDKRIHAAVKYAWSIVLDPGSYQEDLPWSRTNGDSLKAMELWFHIETKLGFKLPLDALDQDARPSDLVAAIRRHLAPTQASSSATAPLVFLMPGILSDDPALARFRAAFGNNVRFQVLDYPGWRQMAAADISFDVIAASVFKQICDAAAEPSYRLAGYSFGGVVAFDVALRLQNAGRSVAFLGLLDSRRWDLTQAAANSGFDPKTEPAVAAARQAIARLVRQRRFVLLGAIERTLMLRPSRLAFWFRRQVAREMRFQAMRHWRPQPLDIPTFLYLSDDRWPGEPDDYGWDRVCSSLTTIHVGGTHNSLIQAPHRESISASFLRALA